MPSDKGDEGYGRLGVFRAMLESASLLAMMYLALGVAVDGVRRLYAVEWLDLFSRTFEAMPAHALQWLGLLEPLRHRYLEQGVGEFGIRFIFGATTVAIIFVLALVVAMFTGGLRLAFSRRKIV